MSRWSWLEKKIEKGPLVAHSKLGTHFRLYQVITAMSASIRKNKIKINT